MVTQEEFKGYPANPLDLSIICDDHHPLFNRRSAGRMEFSLLFDPNQAYSANAIRREPRTIAQSRDENPSTSCRFQDGHPFPGLHFQAVYSQGQVIGHCLLITYLT
jgi:hypothetical protein